MQYSKVLDRLQNLIKREISQKELCKILNIKQSAMGNRASRDSHFSDNEINILENHFNVSLLEDSDCIIVDYVHINPSCGYGTAIIDEPDITPIKLGKKMIETVLRVTDVNNLKIFKASGDSMSDTIDDSNLLLVDMGRTDYTNGGVFLLQKNNDWFIKRLHLKLSGELEVISDNPKYEKETFNPNTDIEIAVRGRIIKNLSKGL